jgi:5-methylcytosine-specific restriction endonuclease McrA
MAAQVYRVFGVDPTNNAAKEYYEKKKREYLDRDDVQIAARKRTRNWVCENSDRKREMDKKFAEENRALVRSYKAARRARVRKAIPPWQTEEDIFLIQQIYADCERISRETGIPHEVDHIVPLEGKFVNGLHTPSNLRIITAEENNRRTRIWNVDAQDCVL